MRQKLKHGWRDSPIVPRTKREMVAMTELDPNHPTYAFELAKALEEREEPTLGPCDSEICARALRLYADWLEANSAA